MVFTISFVQFYRLGQQDLRHFSFVLDRQGDIFEKLILEISNSYSMVCASVREDNPRGSAS